MKTFLNVLYRRILYKIPLKLLLVLLAVFGVLFASFSKSDYIGDFSVSYKTISPNYTYNISNISSNFCISKNDSKDLVWYYSGDSSNLTALSLFSSKYNCFSPYSEISVLNRSSSTARFYILYIDNWFINNLLSGYIEGSSIDSQYCVSNNLCPSNVLMTENQCKSIYGLINSNSCPFFPDCPDNPNIGTSNLYINDVFHPGAFNIIMNIPEEIDWDYAYTNSGQNFNIDVVGYNVDYEKVQSVIDLQNYKPTDNDFSEIISVLAPYSKIIIFFVVLFSLWAMVKKPFKSKKL